MKQNDTSVFKGHRERMRTKLHSFGTRVFETYELLEMLLYNVIPRRNTHPTAKLLLREFPSLDSLFGEEREKLAKVLGVGEECAQFLYDVGAFLNHEEQNTDSFNNKIFSSYEEIGEFFAQYFRGKNENETAILLLKADLSYIDILKIYPLDLSSGAVQAKPFIDAAFKRSASVCAIAHNHPHSSPYPTDGDWETGKALKAAFSEVGLVLLENYVITEEGYKRFSSDNIQKTNSSSKPYLNNSERKHSSFYSLLLPILRRASKDCEKILDSIEKNFDTKTELFESDIDKLMSITNSKSASELLVIVAALASRKKTEGFKFGKKHSEEEIKNFLVGYYLNASSELLTLLPLDKNGNVLAIEALSEGTVNATNVIPRAILEKLNSHASCDFIMAHNHPSGIPEPSLEDVSASVKLYETLISYGVRLLQHYVVAKGECRKIDFLEN